METLEILSNQYGFLTPLLLPWLQTLCRDSVEDQLKPLWQKELTTPSALLSRTHLSFRSIRETIIPRLVEYLETAQPSPDLYLKTKLHSQFKQQLHRHSAHHISHNDQSLLQRLLSSDRDAVSNDELSSISLSHREFELFLTDILHDVYGEYNMRNMLSMETMMVVQYIRSLLFECDKNLKHDDSDKWLDLESYSGAICCNLLSLLKDEYVRSLSLCFHHQFPLSPPLMIVLLHKGS